MNLLFKVSFFALFFGSIFYSGLLGKIGNLVSDINNSYIAFLPSDLIVFILIVVFIIVIYIITVFSK